MENNPNNTIGERLARVEVILPRVENLIKDVLRTVDSRFDHLERSFSDRFAEVKREQDYIKDELNALKDAEGVRLKYLKNKTVEYVLMAILGIIIGALGKAFLGGGL